MPTPTTICQTSIWHPLPNSCAHQPHTVLHTHWYTPHGLWLTHLFRSPNRPSLQKRRHLEKKRETKTLAKSVENVCNPTYHVFPLRRCRPHATCQTAVFSSVARSGDSDVEIPGRGCRTRVQFTRRLPQASTDMSILNVYTICFFALFGFFLL